MSIYFYLAMSILVIIHSKTILIKIIQTTFIPFNQLYIIVSKHKSIISINYSRINSIRINSVRINYIQSWIKHTLYSKHIYKLHNPLISVTPSICSLPPFPPPAGSLFLFRRSSLCSLSQTVVRLRLVTFLRYHFFIAVHSPNSMQHAFFTVISSYSL